MHLPILPQAQLILPLTRDLRPPQRLEFVALSTQDRVTAISFVADLTA